MQAPEITVRIDAQTHLGARLVERLRSLVRGLDGERAGATWWLALRAALGLDEVDALVEDLGDGALVDAREAAALVAEICPLLAAREAPPAAPPAATLKPRENPAHAPGALRQRGLTWCQREVFAAMRCGEPPPSGTRAQTLDALVRAGLLVRQPRQGGVSRHVLALDDVQDRAWAWNLRYGVGAHVTVWIRESMSRARCVPGRLVSQCYFTELGIPVADVRLGTPQEPEHDGEGEIRTVPIDHLGRGGARRLMESAP